jgi:hypothetical protein
MSVFIIPKIMQLETISLY